MTYTITFNPWTKKPDYVSTGAATDPHPGEADVLLEDGYILLKEDNVNGLTREDG